MNYPTFSGNREESVSEWIKITRTTLKKNQVSNQEKVQEVMKHISGDARFLIPEGIENIEVLFTVLNDLFDHNIFDVIDQKYQEQQGEEPAEMIAKVLWYNEDKRISKHFKVFPEDSTTTVDEELTKVRKFIEHKIRKGLQELADKDLNQLLENLMKETEDSGKEKLFLKVNNVDEYDDKIELPD